MTEPIKLKNAGDHHTMDVLSCLKLAMGKFPEYEFTGHDGSRVRMPEKSALRQLERLQLTADSVAGRRITISRDLNPADIAKPFWGITAAAGNGGPVSAGAGATTQPAPTPKPAAPAKQKSSDIYLAITKWVLTDVANLYVEAGLGFDASTAAAICATIFIQQQRNGGH